MPLLPFAICHGICGLTGIRYPFHTSFMIMSHSTPIITIPYICLSTSMMDAALFMVCLAIIQSVKSMSGTECFTAYKGCLKT